MYVLKVMLVEEEVLLDIVRDRKFIMAYLSPLQGGSFTGAETKALLIGVKWCGQNGITSLEIETNSMAICFYYQGDQKRIGWNLLAHSSLFSRGKQDHI